MEGATMSEELTWQEFQDLLGDIANTWPSARDSLLAVGDDGSFVMADTHRIWYDMLSGYPYGDLLAAVYRYAGEHDRSEFYPQGPTILHYVGIVQAQDRARAKVEADRQLPPPDPNAMTLRQYLDKHGWKTWKDLAKAQCERRDHGGLGSRVCPMCNDRPPLSVGMAETAAG